MQQEVYKALTKLKEIQAPWKTLRRAKATPKGAGEKNNQLKGIGKGVAWDNVAEGIGKITNQLANGARAAVNFGKKLIASAKGSTGLGG